MKLRHKYHIAVDSAASAVLRWYRRDCDDSQRDQSKIGQHPAEHRGKTLRSLLAYDVAKGAMICAHFFALSSQHEQNVPRKSTKTSGQAAERHTMTSRVHHKARGCNGIYETEFATCGENPTRPHTVVRRTNIRRKFMALEDVQFLDRMRNIYNSAAKDPPSTLDACSHTVPAAIPGRVSQNHSGAIRGFSARKSGLLRHDDIDMKHNRTPTQDYLLAARGIASQSDVGFTLLSR